MSQSPSVALGFIEGIGLVLSPCILPILPLILSGSLMGSRRRPFGIIIGFVIFFALFTFFSRALVQNVGLNPLLIRQIAYVLLALLGLVMLSEKLSEIFLQKTAGLMRVGSSWSVVNGQGGGFWSGVLFGGLTAVLWTPCAGPILAAVIIQTALQQAGWDSFLTIFAFALGAGVPMLLIALFGRTIIRRVSFLSTHTGLIRRALGVIILLAVGWMVYTDEASALTVAAPEIPASSVTATKLKNALASPYPAPEIVDIDTWFNSPPLQISKLRGKVVLIDFWTYSCINCIRTLPYIRSWYEKYHDRGLVIIGVHTPEFEFEKDPNNVFHAVKSDEILYPVALDNAYGTWQSFNNHYWPAHYLIDKKGQVVYQSFGEGDYDVTENNIRYLLQVGEDIPQTEPMQTEVQMADQTPETYFGYARTVHFAGKGALQRDKSAEYTFPNQLPRHGWALSGRWKVYSDRIVSESKEAALRMAFKAGKVFFVMGSLDHQPVPVTILYQGKKLELSVDEHRLYTAIDMNAEGGGLIEVKADRPGLEIYTATFGG